MQLGVTFPQTEIGADVGGVRAYAEAAEGLGYDYVLAYDHVLGAEVRSRPEWKPTGARAIPYTHADMFHEPLTLFAYLAGVTKRLRMATGVLVLGQRQTALVAKQAAEVDVLSGGRLRLGVGLGWNDVEYESLGMDFHTRGRRVEEQVAALRALWTQEVVTFKGRWHTITAAGINPLPVQRPIPIWFGGTSEQAYKRAARLGDGFFFIGDAKRLAATVAQVRGWVTEAGRDVAGFGMEGSVQYREGEMERVRAEVEGWRALGASHVTVQTMRAGLQGAAAHIKAITQAKAAIG